MQENPWDRLRDSHPGARNSHNLANIFSCISVGSWIESPREYRDLASGQPGGENSLFYEKRGKKKQVCTFYRVIEIDWGPTHKKSEFSAWDL